MANLKDYKQAVEPEKLNQWECIPTYAHTNIEDNFNADKVELPNHPRTRPAYVATDTLRDLIETNSRNLILGGALEIAQTKARNIEVVN